MKGFLPAPAFTISFDADADAMQVVTTSTEELKEFLPAPAVTICPTFGSMLFGFPR